MIMYFQTAVSRKFDLSEGSGFYFRLSEIYDHYLKPSPETKVKHIT